MSWTRTYYNNNEVVLPKDVRNQIPNATEISDNTILCKLKEISFNH